MSRRDTIIVAVLINAGLLIVLFASALKSSSGSSELAASTSSFIQETTPESTFKKETAYVAGDEVDQALNQFSQTPSPVAAISSPAMPSQSATSSTVAASSSSFAEDLNAIATPDALSANPMIQTSSAPVFSAQVLQPARSASEWIEVKVKKGDVLEKIARHHHTTVAEIMKANKLTSSNLRIGQVLKIPNSTFPHKVETHSIASNSSAPIPTENSSIDISKFYIVKKGDSPWTIAVKNHLKVEDLLKLNNMNEDQARRLKPGDQLRIK